MAERQLSKPEIGSQKRIIKLPPAIGDWTTYKPPKVMIKKIKTGLYGFDRLSKDDLDLALRIHYRFISQLLRHFKIDLKMSVELFTINIEQTTYLNFLRSLTGAIVQSKINIPGLHDPVALILDLPLANSIINYALGSHDVEPVNRELTEAENTVLTTTFSEQLPYYVAAFANTIQKPQFEIISSPDITIDSSINTSATFVCFNAEASLADNPPGKISLGYLGNTLKSLLAQYKQIDRRKPLAFSRLPSALQSKIIIPVNATLGKTSLTTREINHLESGDVVSLDEGINTPVETKIGSILKLFCQPGTKDKRTAIRIVAISEGETVEVAPPPLIEEKPAAAAAGPAPLETQKELPEEEAKAAEAATEEKEFPEEEPGFEEEGKEEEEEEDLFGEEEPFEEESGEEEEFPEEGEEEEFK